VPVLDPGRCRTKQGYLWAIARDDRPWGGSEPPCETAGRLRWRPADHDGLQDPGRRRGLDRSRCLVERDNRSRRVSAAMALVEPTLDGKPNPSSGEYFEAACAIATSTTLSCSSASKPFPPDDICCTLRLRVATCTFRAPGSLWVNLDIDHLGLLVASPTSSKRVGMDRAQWLLVLLRSDAPRCSAVPLPSHRHGRGALQPTNIAGRAGAIALPLECRCETVKDGPRAPLRRCPNSFDVEK
jgi:hypothetical protein